MGKPTICIGENKDADQLRGNREADQRLCFRYSDSTIPLLLKPEISSFYLFSVLVQLGLCRTCSEITLLVFPRGGSYNIRIIGSKMSCIMRKLAFCICENRCSTVTAQLISAFVFAKQYNASSTCMHFQNFKHQTFFWYCADMCQTGSDTPKTGFLVARLIYCTQIIYEPPRGKTNNVVSDQVRHKPACTVTEES